MVASPGRDLPAAVGALWLRPRYSAMGSIGPRSPSSRLLAGRLIWLSQYRRRRGRFAPGVTCLSTAKGHRLRIRETQNLRVAYAGPFQMGAEEMPEEMKYFAAATGRGGHLPHELSIWRKGRPRRRCSMSPGTTPASLN